MTNLQSFWGNLAHENNVRGCQTVLHEKQKKTFLNGITISGSCILAQEGIMFDNAG